MHGHGRADGDRLVEADDHVDLRVLHKELHRADLCRRGVGVDVDRIDVLHTRVSRQRLAKAALALLPVAAAEIKVHDADRQAVPVRLQGGAPGHAPGLDIVRADAHADAVGVHVAVDDGDLQALLGRAGDCLGVFRVADGGIDDGIRTGGDGFVDKTVLLLVILLRLRPADRQIDVIFRFCGVRSGKGRFPEFRVRGFGDEPYRAL